MNILFDSMSTQVQVQAATGSRLNTLITNLINAGNSVSFSDYGSPIGPQLTNVNVFIVLTQKWTQVQDGPPAAPTWPPVIPESTNFSWSQDDLNAIQSWVKGGGSLLLVSSHTDFTVNDIPLAALFGIKLVPAFFCLNTNTLQDPLIMTPTDNWPGLVTNVNNVQAWDSCGVAGTSGDVSVILPFPSGTYDGSDNNYNPSYYAFAVATTYGYGDVVVAGHSGIAGDPGSWWPSPGQIGDGNDLQFLLNCVSYLGSDESPT